MLMRSFNNGYASNYTENLTKELFSKTIKRSTENNFQRFETRNTNVNNFNVSFIPTISTRMQKEDLKKTLVNNNTLKMDKKSVDLSNSTSKEVITNALSSTKPGKSKTSFNLNNSTKLITSLNLTSTDLSKTASTIKIAAKPTTSFILHKNKTNLNNYSSTSSTSSIMKTKNLVTTSNSKRSRYSTDYKDRNEETKHTTATNVFIFSSVSTKDMIKKVTKIKNYFPNTSSKSTTKNNILVRKIDSKIYKIITSTGEVLISLKPMNYYES